MGLKPRQEAQRRNLFLYVLLTVGGFLILAPFVWTLLTSFKTPPEIQRLPPSILPDQWHLSNYATVFQRLPFLRFMLNSAVVTAISVLVSLFLASLAGYEFAKFDFPLKNVVFFAIISLLMVPFQAIVVPLYLWAARLGWVNTYQGLLMPTLVSAFGVYLMREAIEAIPGDYFDAARIDGCSELRIYWTIVLPFIRPALAALGIIKFLWTWNEFFWPLVITSTDSMKVVTMGLSEFTNMYFIEYHLATAASIISIIPVVVVFLLLQQWVVKAITLSGLKG